MQKKRESRPVSSGQYTGLFHQGASSTLLPIIKIPLLDGIYQSTFVYQDQGLLASALGGGGRRGYFKLFRRGYAGRTLKTTLIPIKAKPEKHTYSYNLTTKKNTLFVNVALNPIQSIYHGQSYTIHAGCKLI